MGGLVVAVFGLIFGLVALASTVFWIWMIIDCLTKEPSEGNDKIVWALVVILLGWIGAAIYFFARRPKRMATFGR